MANVVRKNDQPIHLSSGCNNEVGPADASRKDARADMRKSSGNQTGDGYCPIGESGLDFANQLIQLICSCMLVFPTQLQDAGFHFRQGDDA